jgi:hypothetical protein
MDGRQGLGPMLLALALGGCYEGLDGTMAGNAVSDETDGSDDSGVDDAQADACAPVPAAMRRLSRRELDRTLRDLLGDHTQPALRRLADDQPPGGYDTHVQANPITEALAYDYLVLAEDVASRAVEDLEALLGCDAEEGEACARSFSETLCPRAFRRPCSTEEIDGWVDVWSTAAGGDDPSPARGYRILLTTVLQTADFLYRPEIGTPIDGAAGQVELTSWEIASRLSYFLWGTMPDEALFAAAEADELRDELVLLEQARRMLGDPRAVDQVVDFHQQWLGLGGLQTSIKSGDFSGYAELREHISAQSARLVEHVVLGGGNLEELLTASYTFVNDPLAEFYGLPAPGTGDELVLVTLDEGRHAGILSQPAFLATYASVSASSPVRRGVTILQDLLCNPLPPPPPDVDDTLPELDLDGTTRQRYEAHTLDPQCAGCHRQIDGLGFAFEHFDAVGRWRDEENGFPIDASGELVGTDVDGPFDGAAALGRRLAESTQVRNCYVENLFEYAYGRTTTAADRCATDALSEAFAAAEGDFEALVLGFVANDAFRLRSIEE